jgi:hypothetical protein
MGSPVDEPVRDPTTWVIEGDSGARGSERRTAMEWLLGGLIVAVMVVVRLVVPVAITVGVVTALHRLDSRWQAQSMALSG